MTKNLSTECIMYLTISLGFYLKNTFPVKICKYHWKQKSRDGDFAVGTTAEDQFVKDAVPTQKTQLLL